MYILGDKRRYILEENKSSKRLYQPDAPTISIPCVCIMCNILLATESLLDNPLFCPKNSEDVQLIPKLIDEIKDLGEPENVRLVFGFDD